jgi:cytidine deaminase
MDDKSLQRGMCELARITSLRAGVSMSDGSVGAAVIADDRRIFAGRYLRGTTASSTAHAEFAAIVNALSNGCNGIVALAVFVSTPHQKHPPVPCGACLQAISDYSSVDNVQLFISNSDLYPHWNEHSLSEFLPHPWRR